jgi:hypothetical protein
VPVEWEVRHHHASGEAVTPEAIAGLAIKYARERVANEGNQRLAFSLALVEEYLFPAIRDAVREVHITAPGIVLEDRREQGGAIVSDLRGVQDKANG